MARLLLNSPVWTACAIVCLLLAGAVGPSSARSIAIPSEPDTCSSSCGFQVALLPPVRLPGTGEVVLPCADGLDNDGDGVEDFPDDPGCMSPADASERGLDCDDGLDNDGDGTVDAADDPGCSSLADASEREPGLVCDDGLDNDGDGRSDHPGDPYCSGPTDSDEAGPSAIDNPGFEAGGSCPPAGWTYYHANSGNGCVVSSPVRSGSAAAEVSDPNTSVAAGITSSCVEVAFGDLVTATVHYRGTSPPGSNAYLNLYLEFFSTPTPANSMQRTHVAWGSVAASSTTWAPFSVSDAAPSGAACAWILLYSPIGADGSYYVDDVSLVVA